MHCFSCVSLLSHPSFLSWGDGSCNLVCEVVFIDKPYAVTIWTFVCFLFLPWVDGCCMVIRKLQVIEIPCAATVCLCYVIRITCFLFYRENWWKLMFCLLMLFIVVNMSFEYCISYYVHGSQCMKMLFELLDLSPILGIHAALFGALLLEFIYINCVYFVRCQMNLQLQILEYNICYFLDDFCTCWCALSWW